MANDMDIRTAQRVCEAHGHATYTEDGGRTLYAEVAWTRRRADGTIEWGTSWEVVPYARRRALYEWLGY